MFADAPAGATGATDAAVVAAADELQGDNKNTVRPAAQTEAAAQDQSGAADAAGDAIASGAQAEEQAACRQAGEAGGATEASGSVPDDYICVPPPMENEAGVSNLPTTASLVSKLREVCFFLNPFLLSIRFECLQQRLLIAPVLRALGVQIPASTTLIDLPVFIINWAMPSC